MKCNTVPKDVVGDLMKKYAGRGFDIVNLISNISNRSDIRETQKKQLEGIYSLVSDVLKENYQRGQQDCTNTFAEAFAQLRAVVDAARELADIPVVDFAAQRGKLAEIRTLLSVLDTEYEHEE